MRRWVLCAVAVCSACGLPEATFSVRESVGQLQVTHAPQGATLEVVDAHGKVVATGVADAQGSLVFRQLAPASGYRVRLNAERPSQTPPLKVLSVEGSLPDTSFYAGQTLVAGFNYLTMRDGTTLSAWVTLPPGNGPFPTVVNYSGYDASRPQAPDPDLAFLCGDFPVLCTPPTDGSALIAGMLGYATVSVNVRGTGCSGGAYDYFEPLQLLDGYDVIEIVGAQRWAAHHKVGMVGLSYPGITQLFVASAKPPSLAAIAPMSVVGSTDSTLLPGGILNDGFALAWVDRVLSRAVPWGQGWERARVDAGDTVCAENQLLHSQLIDNVAQARATAFVDPTLYGRLDPSAFAPDIEVPVFLTGQWQDEQTGPYFFKLLDRFTRAPAKHFVVTNGVHIDGFAPQQTVEWQTFLELYVARRKPIEPKVQNLAGLFYQRIFGASISLPPARFVGYATRDEAQAAWEAEPPLQVLFESGAGNAQHVGTPVAAWEHRFTQWPPKETRPRTLYFEPDGSLGEAAPAAAAAASAFTLNPAAGQTGVLAPGGNVWDALPDYAWQQPGPGAAVVMESAPLTADTVLLGTASVDLWLSSPVDDADLQVTLSEVRPDGQEMYIQSGWLRASFRTPGPAATELWPAQTITRDDEAPLPLDTWTQVRVGTAGFAHALRAGSRVRVSVDTPGGVRAEWRFALKSFDGPVTYGIAHDAAHPSKLVLPVVEGVAVGAPLPACPSLRGQPCRAHVPYENAAFP